MLHALVRRPLFSAGAALAVLGATGAAHLSTEAPGTRVVTSSVAAPALTPEQAAAAAAQSAADTADAAAVEALARRAAAAEEAQALAAQQAAAAEALAAERAAAAARADRRRRDAVEQVTRDAVRDPRTVARVLAGEKGWGAEQFSCLDRLWTKESGWEHTADNPTSSAYGIPQALPGSKMSSFGEDWETNPVTQIRWGLHYIDTVYGTPCSAWEHSRAHDWY